MHSTTILIHCATGDSFMVSGDSAGELKVWSTNGEPMGSFSHGQCITSLRSFQDNLGGQPGKCNL